MNTENASAPIAWAEAHDLNERAETATPPAPDPMTAITAELRGIRAALERLADMHDAAEIMRED